MPNLTHTANVEIEKNADTLTNLRGFIHSTPRPVVQRSVRYAKTQAIRPPDPPTKLRLRKLPNDPRLREQLLNRDATPAATRRAAIVALKNHADALLSRSELKEYGDVLKSIRELEYLERFQL